MLFDCLDARQIVELFVTINAKHTRLNPSHIISLAGRKLYPDPNQALAHDVIRSLNDDKPFDLFIQEQLAGDEYVTKETPADAARESIIATGFLRLGPSGGGGGGQTTLANTLIQGNGQSQQQTPQKTKAERAQELPHEIFRS